MRCGNWASKWPARFARRRDGASRAILAQPAGPSRPGQAVHRITDAGPARHTPPCRDPVNGNATPDAGRLRRSGWHTATPHRQRLSDRFRGAGSVYAMVSPRSARQPRQPQPAPIPPPACSEVPGICPPDVPTRAAPCPLRIMGRQASAPAGGCSLSRAWPRGLSIVGMGYHIGSPIPRVAERASQASLPTRQGVHDPARHRHPWIAAAWEPN